MKKLLLVSLCFLMLCTAQVYAQNRTVTGTVTASDDGQPIPGVTVKVKGTSVGTQTNTVGKFTLSAPQGATLVFSFIGYETQEHVADGTTLNVSLNVSAKQLGEVVVTGALGIKRQAKEQGYAATQIEAKSLTEAHPTNFTNGLTAKAPGLVISTVDNGINPDTRFTLRGNRHINGNNYALVVLNGVPVSPNEVNTINPDDIESVNILNGAGAAALYGSEASNGALVITTKRGSSTGAPQLTYTNTFLFEKIAYFPSLQTRFGSYGGEGTPYEDPLTGYITTPVPYENQSYGPAYNGQLIQLGSPLADGTVQKVPYSTPSKDPRQAFFNMGHSDEHNVSYASGDATNGLNLSVNRLDRVGTVPNDSYNRTTARISATKTSGILKIDGTAGFTQSNTSKAGAGFSGVDDGDVLTILLNTPSWVPITKYKDINAPFGDANTYFNAYGINPYEVIANSRINTTSNVFNGSFNATLSPTKWLDATYRLADNTGAAIRQSTQREVDFSAYALSNPVSLASSSGASKFYGAVSNESQYGDGSIETGAGPQGFSRIQQDVFVNMHHTFFNDFKTSLLLGNTIWQEYLQYLSNGSSNLLVKDYYNVNSILGTPNVGQVTEKIRQVAFFGDLSIGYKDFAFLEGTLRNDHDSRLSEQNRSFFYPSVKGSFIFTDAIPGLKGNHTFSYGKLRASYSQVGDVNIGPYSINNTFLPTGGFPYGNTGGLSLNTTLNNPKLKPEITDELEFGGDFGFLDNRVNGSITYYDSKTKDQTLAIATSPSTGYTNTLINVGEVQNTGFEFKLDVQVLTKQQNKVGLTLGGNLSIQNSKVISLSPGLNSISIGGYTSASVNVVVGKPYPELYGTDILRDPQGHPIVDAVTGAPSSNPNLVDLGRLTPKYLMGLTQTVSYKFVTLNVVSEFRTGNVIYNAGLNSATAAGVSALSAEAGRQVFVFPNSVIQTAPGVYVKNTNTTIQDGNLGFWDAGAYYHSASTYVTSGAFWKLREADLAFDISQFAKKSKFIKKASFALVGRNLVMLRPKSNNWTDPEFAYSSGNGGLGVNNTNQNPPTRIFGASLSVTF